MIAAPLSTTPADADCSRRLARLATRSLYAELALYPKPGLVSLHDTGAHADMDARTFVRSLFALRGYFAHIAQAGARGSQFNELRALGIRAEAAMLTATDGVNTHRGAIFVLGLLCASAARARALGAGNHDAALRAALRREWSAALTIGWSSPRPPSHGAEVAERHGVSGARGEASRAFPSVFEIALPALREALAGGASTRRARLAALFALLESVDDTNVLFRGGKDALAFVHASARQFRRAGFVFSVDAFARAEKLHAAFIARGLSPGGCADLLAATLFVHALQNGTQ